MIIKIIKTTSSIWLTRLLAIGLFALISAGGRLALPFTPAQPITHSTLGFVALSTFAVAWLCCYLLIRFNSMHAHLSHDHDLEGIQKIHTQSVPRVGGLAIMLGLLMSLITLAFIAPADRLDFSYLLWMLLAAMPVFIAGFWEDLTKRVSIRQRLLSSFISAELAALLLQALIPGLGLPLLDHYLTWAPVLLLLTIVGTGGVTHSYNLIDGINGLAAGFTLIMLVALLSVAALVGDGMILLLGVCLFSATLGFLVWNWPRGLLFLGDGGAYLLGFFCSTLLILLVARHPEVSPWFPLALVGYPVMETLFSTYRRILIHEVPHDAPDNRHLHQLMYQWICRERSPRHGAHISCNSLTAVPIWVATALVTAFAVHWYDNTHALVALFLGGVIFYKGVYRFLYFVMFRSPLKRRQPPSDMHSS